MRKTYDATIGDAHSRFSKCSARRFQQGTMETQNLVDNFKEFFFHIFMVIVAM